MATPKKKAKRLKTLVIKESRWLRYGSTRPSALYAKSLKGKGLPGDMCCLGFLAQACGATSRQIEAAVRPQDVPNIKWPKGALKTRHGRQEDTLWTQMAIRINDRPSILHTGIDTPLEERKARLTKHFRKIGFKLVFVP